MSGRRGQLEVGLAAEGQLRWAAVDVTQVVEEARRRLDLAPVPAIAFGRCAAAAAMLLRLAEKTPRRLEVDVRGDGPVGRVLVEARSNGGVRGLVGNAHATGSAGPEDYRVGPAVGRGLLRVRRYESGGGAYESPYESQVELVTGEIGTDIAHYLEQSEQRRSAVLVGVLAQPLGIASAGGLIIEALPGASSRLIDEVEAHLGTLESVSRMFERVGLGGAVEEVLGSWLPRTIERRVVAYRCTCNRARLAAQLQSLSREDLSELLDAEATLTAECAYCGETYRFLLAELAAGVVN
jgi:molecular chaperone Hsp33